jgi:hypothetical protein
MMAEKNLNLRETMKGKHEHGISMWRGILKMRCPSCRRSPMFTDPNPYHWKNMGKMNTICPECGYPLDPEAGYYFGAMYVSYILMVAWNFSIAIAIFLITGELFGNFILLMVLGITTTVAISPVMFRYSRVIWSYLFFRILKK